MLVDDKFIIILIPRCATTSFVATCQNTDIKTKSGKSDIGGYDKIINLTTKKYTHYHDDISFLKKRFGNKYPIIAVKRNQYDWFLSLWKMILSVMLSHHYKDETVKKLSKLTIDDILFFDKNKYCLHELNDVIDISKQFFEINKIEFYPPFQELLSLLYTPQSWYHKFDKDVIWFDFDELNKLEDWVSNQLGREFKLENINSSKSIDSVIVNDEYYKKKLDSIYLKYEVIKENKTMI
jgi:hypothetical protein